MNRLTGIHALITRPETQAQTLASRIRQHGGQVYLLPTIEIIPCLTSDQLAGQLATLPPVDILIFISPSAIEQACSLLQQQTHLAWQTKPCVVMGEPSARLLKQYGPTDIHYPTSNYSAEAGLALPRLQQVAQRHIVIFKGEGGRTLLADTLRERGARVSEVICYQRRLPTLTAEQHQRLLQQTDINCIVSTSIVSADNLRTLLGPAGITWWRERQWVVSSQRIANHLLDYRLTKPLLIAPNASDNAIISTLGRVDNSPSE
jgi:uroporphyrinogen-III synthase